MKPFFIEQAEAPERWSRDAITAQARRWAHDLEPDEVLALWRRCLNAPSMLDALEDEARLLLEQVAWGITLEQSHLDLELIVHRTKLLQIICHSRHTLLQRQTEALDYCVSSIEVLSGFSRWLAADPDSYQLRQTMAWWRPDGEWGGFSQNEAFVKHHEKDPHILRENSFEHIAQEDYRRRALPHVLRRWLWGDPENLLSVAAIVHFYTGVLAPVSSHEQEIRALREQLIERLPSLERRHTALPMKPLYSLPRESKNVYRLIKTGVEELQITEHGTLSSTRHETARAKLLKPDQLLLFDTSMVLKRSGQADSFMSVLLESPERDVLSALFAATEQLGLEPALLEHLPRIVMGCFTAAHTDRKLFNELTHEGAFWDTESGRRLCKITGFNPENHKHRARVQQVRQLLCKLRLHREVVTTQGKKIRTTVQWEGPLIQPLQDRLEIKREDQEGVGEQQVFQSWLIAKELWNMTQPSSKVGGTPAFMLLDQRAFQMDPTSSVPFNLYWTLVNRAYVDLSRAPDKPFRLGLETWCAWAGVEVERPAALRKTLVEALGLMQDHELLVSWRCESLSASRPPTLKQLREDELEVMFHPSQARVLPSFEGALER